MDKSNSDVAEFFRRVADLLELKGENPFKTRSYRTASEMLGDLARPIADMARTGGAAELQSVPGVGKSISAQILEIVETGTSTFFEQLRGEIPETVADLLRVRGIGIKTAQTLYRDFGILDLDDLGKFVDGGGLEAVPGLGERAVGRMLSSLEEIRSQRPKLSLAEAVQRAGAFAGALAAAAATSSITPVGEIRRRCGEVFAIELLAVTEGERATVSSAFARVADAGEAIVLIPERAEVATGHGVRALVHVVESQSRWAALVRTTGSRRHVRELEELAAAKGMEFRGYALSERAGNAKPVSIELDDEADFYAQLGLPLIAPEAREGAGEIEAALGTK
jgi:DNA polymerase (family 10)